MATHWFQPKQSFYIQFIDEIVSPLQDLGLIFTNSTMDVEKMAEIVREAGVTPSMWISAVNLQEWAFYDMTYSDAIVLSNYFRTFIVRQTIKMLIK